jgi:hypothetical protein
MLGFGLEDEERKEVAGVACLLFSSFQFWALAIPMSA